MRCNSGNSEISLRSNYTHFSITHHRRQPLPSVGAAKKVAASRPSTTAWNKRTNLSSTTLLPCRRHADETHTPYINRLHQHPVVLSEVTQTIGRDRTKASQPSSAPAEEKEKRHNHATKKRKQKRNTAVLDRRGGGAKGQPFVVTHPPILFRPWSLAKCCCRRSSHVFLS